MTEIRETGESKTARIPIKIIPESRLKKPNWIKMHPIQGPKFMEVTNLLREQSLVTVCEQASCPNIAECFSKGTATFMILGDLCTRRCPFCDVPHGRPKPPDQLEPLHLAEAIQVLKLKYVVITSVDRDDLLDGGSQHFMECVKSVRDLNPQVTIELLVPDFRGRLGVAIESLSQHPPEVLNHNLETVPRLYKQVRPGADYLHSLSLLESYKAGNPQVLTKSGLMVGLGETEGEVLDVMKDLRDHEVDMLTIGQYLQPSEHHLPVKEYITPEKFEFYTEKAKEFGFLHAACGPMVRSSYHADKQASPLIGNQKATADL
ncbi:MULTISPECIES: lipoyl synthase [Bacteria]|jgi:lipoyl synthase|uniref:Lipoyl synthase n=1 Tax=Merismopedia glauca CCAP 1448/3 TaxID=1296344 RepID=A0A2T1C5U2_9CYAN|nr:lipoyl synthase [Merismopedia glauca]PSB03631.1 lipoyl synthase [Merismopedia glauca CCAP 1448/3]